MYKLGTDFIDPLDGFEDFAEYCFAVARGAKMTFFNGGQVPCDVRVLYERHEEVYRFNSHSIQTNTSEINELIAQIKQNNSIPFAFTISYVANDADGERAIFVIGANRYEEQAYFIKSLISKQDSINGGEKVYDHLYSTLSPLLNLIGINLTSISKEKTCNKRKVNFGHYPQKSGTDMSDISWFVMSEDEDKLLLVSEFALDCKPYNETNTNCEWANCSLRSWLNSNFLNAAFNEIEQKAIIEEKHSSSENRMFGIPSGTDVNDKVFIISHVNNPQLFEKSSYRIVLPTPYAISNGAIVVDKEFPKLWTRDFGETKNKTGYISDDGFSVTNGTEVNSRHIGVRPAIWVKKEFFAPKTKAPTTTQKPSNHESIAKRRQSLGVCQHCGGNFKGLFRKKCSSCGKLKDY
jgi:hypothetical protein